MVECILRCKQPSIKTLEMRKIRSWPMSWALGGSSSSSVSWVIVSTFDAGAWADFLAGVSGTLITEGNLQAGQTLLRLGENVFVIFTLVC